MKTKFFLFVIFCLPAFVWGQEPVLRDTSEVINVTNPKFTGIKNVAHLFTNQTETIGDYLHKNIKYPEEAARCYKQGTAVVKFTVTAEGELTDFQVLNSVCPVIDNELIRVLKNTDGMWNPGISNEEFVDMPQEVSMMFVASSNNNKAPKEYFTKMARNHFAKANTLFLEKHNLKRALKSYDQSIKYLPYDASLLLIRGLCKYELGDAKGAISDWERINELGTYNADWCFESLTDLSGYDQMMEIVEK